MLPGYGRMQGIVHRRDDARFAGKGVEAALAAALGDPECAMVNRNTGSGTRVVIDALLGVRRPPGYAVQVKSHNAVAAAVQQRRADWGVAINTVAEQYGLGFIRCSRSASTSRCRRLASRGPPCACFASFSTTRRSGNDCARWDSTRSAICAPPLRSNARAHRRCGEPNAFRRRTPRAQPRGRRRSRTDRGLRSTHRSRESSA